MTITNVNIGLLGNIVLLVHKVSTKGSIYYSIVLNGNILFRTIGCYRVYLGSACYFMVLCKCFSMIFCGIVE